MDGKPTFKSNLKYIFVLVFCYSVLASFAIQFILLPYFFPSLDGGNGLLKHHDWVSYHRLAAEMVVRMNQKGWSQWELRPFGWIEIGLTSFVYYFTVSKPWVLIPLNAFIHASTAVIILLILKPVLPLSRKSFLWAVAPFVFFPTSLLWVAQIHKDGIAFFACLLFIYALIRLSSPFFGSSNEKRPLLVGTTALLLGAISGWTVRPYLGDIFALQLFVLSLILTLCFFFSPKKFLSRKGSVASLVVVWVLTFSLRPILNLGTYQSNPPAPTPEVIAESGGRGFDTAITHAPTQNKTKYHVASGVEEWKYTPYLPKALEDKLYTISRIRHGYANTISSTNVDSEVELRSFMDFVRYVPRAVQVVLACPNPFSETFWTKDAGGESRFQKQLVRLEMVALYLFLPLYLFQLIRFRKRFEVVILFSSSMMVMLVYTFTVTNLGTLHRFRYGFIALLLGLATTAIPEIAPFFRSTLRLLRFNFLRQAIHRMGNHGSPEKTA